MAFDILHHAVNRLALAPGFRQARQRVFDRYFEHNPGLNLFRGVYTSRVDALAAIPEHQRAGYDSERAAELYVAWDEVFDYDYPALFWLQRSFADGLTRIFDLGGNVGIKFYAYRKLTQFPRDLSWSVSDVPAVVKRGRALAAERGASSQLSFTTELGGVADCDVLFASGVLQYLPETLPELLTRLHARPRRILINITPLHETRDYFTVNSMGEGFCAYHVQRRAALLGGLEECGYRLVQAWKNEGKVLDMPFDPGCGLTHYSGLWLERID